MKRLLVVAVVDVFGGVVYGVLKPVRDETSATRVGERLTDALQAPGQGRRNRVPGSCRRRVLSCAVSTSAASSGRRSSLLINWKDLWLALNGGQWVWGEATVAPMTMTAAQAIAAVKTIPGGGRIAAEDFDDPLRVHSHFRLTPVSGTVRRRRCVVATTGASAPWS